MFVQSAFAAESDAYGDIFTAPSAGFAGNTSAFGAFWPNPAFDAVNMHALHSRWSVFLRHQMEAHFHGIGDLQAAAQDAERPNAEVALVDFKRTAGDQQPAAVL